MLEILSWNIQYAKGVDNVTSVKRIADDIEQFGDADVICLQEVLRTPEQEHVAELSARFPDHECVFGPAINRLYPSGRLEFGNLILSRLPVLQIVQHKLPQPADPEQKHMPRQATELVLVYGEQFLRVTTLHLDYFSARQRSAQVQYLVDHHQECCARAVAPSPTDGEEQFAALPETTRSVYCGDFNLTVDSEDYQRLTNTHNGNGLIDSWRHIFGQKAHAPTCGIYDHEQWQEGAHCRDFFFVSSELAESLSDISVNTTTAASDHQPCKITLR